MILGLLCFVIGLGVGLGSLWPRFQAMANTAGSLRVQTETLQAAHSVLQNKYQELSDDYSQLQSESQNLKDSYDGLQGENAQLQAAYQSAAKGYVDDTGNSEGTGKDTIAFVKIGKPYGLISLEGVREEHIDCPSKPEGFWKSLR